jgi:hypothetical protein
MHIYYLFYYITAEIEKVSSHIQISNNNIKEKAKNGFQRQ